MSWQIDLFQKLATEKASGKVYTLKDWMAANPPSDKAFKQSVARAADLIIQGEPFPFPVRDLLDEFQLLVTPRQRQAAIDESPSPTGDKRYDAYLAALAEHLAATHTLGRPGWVCEPDRFLKEFWFPSNVAGFKAMAIAQSPAAFRRRGIFIPAASLQRV